MKSKIWITTFLVIVIGALFMVAMLVIKIDPFFHYHKPDTNTYYYDLNNQRSQNNGITKNFDYNALITGTSMTENFKTSEFDEIFGVNSIKVSFSGGTYKEINDNVRLALSSNKELKTVVRALNTYNLWNDKDAMRQDLGDYPTYLYDNNMLNDVKYIFNRNVIFQRIYPMLAAVNDEDFSPGITSFDDYSNWMAPYSFGINAVCPEGVEVQTPGEPVHLTEYEKDVIVANVEQNVIALAAEYPDVTFYYFYPPYSIMYWQSLLADGTIYRQIEAEQLAIEMILEYDNIKLYSFNNLTEITTDLNHYKDITHYAEWINSMVLQYMHDGTGLLTEENYEQYLEQITTFYTTYDYSQLNNQVDYESDYDAATLLMEKISE